MKDRQSWNRRDFVAKPMAFLAATHLLGGPGNLFGESAIVEPSTPSASGGGKPINRQLGKTGIRLPVISMGVMNADVPGLIPRSYELGVRHFDTASTYQQGRNEEMVGAMFKQMGKRDQVIISTKAHQVGSGWGRRRNEQARSYSPAEVKAAYMETFESSLKRLQMDYVDIHYSHMCDTEDEIRSEGVLEALAEMKKAGKTRFIGFSTHQPELGLRTATKLGAYDVVLIQFNHTMAEDQGLRTAIEEAAKSGIGIVAMKALAGGSRSAGPNAAGPASPSSVTARLKWVLNHPSITTIIAGYTTYEQMEQSFSVASDIAFTPQEQEFLSNRKNVANAQFCRQCGQCRADCPLGVDIPQLMRSHMYAVQYGNRSLALETLAAIGRGKGLSTCGECDSCLAQCRHSVNIAMKIDGLKEITAKGYLSA